MTRPLILLAVLAFAVTGCAERRYPWPDFDVADDAWVPLPVPPRAPPPAVVPVLVPAVQPAPFDPAPAAGLRS